MDGIFHQADKLNLISHCCPASLAELLAQVGLAKIQAFFLGLNIRGESMDVVNILVLMLFGLLGFTIFYLLNLPTPTLLGSFTIVGAINILQIVELPQVHPDYGVFLQVFLGLFIGLKVEKDILNKVRKIALPVMMISLWALLITLFVGHILFHFTHLDRITAILSSSPGGVAEMAIIALSVNADVSAVSILQLFRMLLTLTIFPIIINHVKGEKDEANNKNSRVGRIKEKARALTLQNITNDFCKKELPRLFTGKALFTISIALLGGFLGSLLPIPAGSLVGSFLAVAIVSVLLVNLEPPPYFLRALTQVGIGSLIGMTLTLDAFISLKYLLLPIILFTILIFGSSLLLAKAVQAITHWDYITCVMATAPAGFSVITILAYEYDTKPVEIGLMHLARIIVIKSFVPFLILLL